VGRRSRAGLTVRMAPGVAADVRRAVLAFARWLRRELGVGHAVRVRVVDRAFIPAGPRWAVARFAFPERAPRRGDACQVLICAGHADYMEATGEARADAVVQVLYSLAHEFVHYGQWRASGRTTERGVAVRSSGLLTRFLAEAA
jgi:hypothetical protein